jgi:hemerythrin-like domain-containing protein
LVVGAGATQLGNSVSSGSSSGSSSGGRTAAQGSVVPPGEILMEEHGVLKRVLLIYDNILSRVAAGQTPPATALHGGALIIHDFIEAFHEALEEGYVFPALQYEVALQPTINTLLLQHGRGRQITQMVLADATTTGLASESTRTRVTAAVAAFVRMYQPHEAREDTIVFPAYRAAIGPAGVTEAGVKFADLARQQFGPNGFTDVVNQVVAIEQSLGIYDLAQFTPPESLV